MAAPVPGVAVHPVRVHPAQAEAASDESGEQVVAPMAVTGRTGGADLQSSNEVPFGHQRRSRRGVGLEALQTAAPPRVRPIRMPAGVHQPVPVRRSPSQIAALLPRLRTHRGRHPMPRPQHLPLRLGAEHHDQRLVDRIAASYPPPASGSHICTPARSHEAGHSVELIAAERPLVLPDDHRVEPPAGRGQLRQQLGRCGPSRPLPPSRTALVEELDLHRCLTRDDGISRFALPRP